MHEKPLKTTAIRYLLCLLIVCLTFSGCGGGEPEEGSVSQSTAKIDDSGRNYTTQKIVIQKIDDKIAETSFVKRIVESITDEMCGYLSVHRKPYTIFLLIKLTITLMMVSFSSGLL